MRGLAPIALVLGLVAAGVYVHELDFDAIGRQVDRAGQPDPGAATARGLLGQSEGWRFQHVDPATGSIDWEAWGEEARPGETGGGGSTSWLVVRPNFIAYDVEAEALSRTAVTAALGRASFPGAADSTLRLEGAVRVQRAGLAIETEEITATMPPGKAGGKHGRLQTTTPVVVRQRSPEVVIRGDGGLRADMGLGTIVLLPPVDVVLDPAALTMTARAPTEERLRLQTDHEVSLVRRLPANGATAAAGSDEPTEADLVFHGPLKGAFDRAAEPGAPPPPRLHGVAPKGGKLLLRKPTKEKASEPAGRTTPPKPGDAGARPRDVAPGAGSGPAAPRAPGEAPSRALSGLRSAEFLDGRLFEGDELVAKGDALRWDVASGIALLEGHALLRGPANPAEEREESIALTADRIAYRPRPGVPTGATVTGNVVARLEGPTFTADVKCGSAEVAFAAGGRERLAPGPARRILARGDVVADFAPVTRTARAAGQPGRAPDGGGGGLAGAKESLLESYWHGEADEAQIDLVERVEPAAGTRTATPGKDSASPGKGAGKAPGSPAAPARPGSGGGSMLGAIGEDVGRIELRGEGRLALLEGRTSTASAPVYTIEGERIAADLVKREAAVFAAREGAPSRQRLRRELDRVEAREIRYFEREGRATARGEVVYERRSDSGEVAVRVEAETAKLGFRPPEPADGGERGIGGPVSPETFEAGGPAGAVVYLVPDLITPTASPAAPGEPRRRIKLTATRIAGAFDEDAATDSPELSEVRAEGSRETPVVVEPAYDAPPDERFRLTGERVVLDAFTGEVRFEGASPRLTRGKEEGIRARDVRFDLGTLTAHLRGGVTGSVLLDLEDTGEPALVDFEADEATVVLTDEGPASGRGGALDAVERLEARGAVRMRDRDPADPVFHGVRADRLEYIAKGRKLRLYGRPLEGTRGKQRISGEVYEVILPPPRPRERKN